MNQPVTDVLSVIESAYRVDVPQHEWLRGLAESARACFGAGFAAAAWTYAIGEDGHMRTLELTWSDAARTDLATDEFRAMHSTARPELIDGLFSGGPRCVLGSDSPRFCEPGTVHEGYLRARGICDVVGVNASDATASGCCIGIPLSRPTRLDASTREVWGRVATHVAAALRLRARLQASAGEGAAAVLTPEGRVEHAEGQARERRSLEALRDAVARVERARGPLRHQPASATAEWRGLVAARWSVLDAFEADGRRYVVARRNDIDPPGPAALSSRERQVVALAHLGRTNKEIAYELGLSHSTVGVLMSRAMKKLGARTRAEALAALRRPR